jgi:hypothetical protein
MVRFKVKLEIAAARDLDRVLHRAGEFGKCRDHLVRRFKIKLIRPEPEPVLVIEHILRLDA